MLDAWVLDTDFNAASVIDYYRSFIWTDRYCGHGDFELYIPVGKQLVSSLMIGNYIRHPMSEHLMVIEDISIQSSYDSGDFLIASGRSIESILDRRIVWGQESFTGNIEGIIQKLLNSTFISPTDAKRKVSNFIFEPADATATIIKNSLSDTMQFTGDNVYDIIVALCDIYEVGFKVTLQNKNFVFKMYQGERRTKEQFKNPYIEFSPTYENILTSDFYQSWATYRNISLVSGEGEGAQRKSETACFDAVIPTGISRKELFVDARDIQSENSNGVTLTSEEYQQALKKRGLEKLAEALPISVFNGEAEATRLFKYNEDFFLGDILYVSNAYGHAGSSRVTEVTISDSDQGFYVYPTFKMENSAL